MGIGVYPHTLFNPINYLTPTFLLITLLLLPSCSCSSTLPSCSDYHTAALLFLLCHSCCLPLLLSYLYLPIPMFIVLLSYSHAHASAVLLQFPIPQTFFNSLLSYSPLLIHLLSCCPTFLLSCSLTFCLLFFPTPTPTPTHFYSLLLSYSWFLSRTLLLLLFYSFTVTRILPAPSLLFPLEYSSFPTLSPLFCYPTLFLLLFFSFP